MKYLDLLIPARLHVRSAMGRWALRQARLEGFLFRRGFKQHVPVTQSFCPPSPDCSSSRLKRQLTEITCCEVGDGGGAVAVSYSCAELLHAWPGSSYFKESSEAVLGAYGTEQNCSHHSFNIFQQELLYCSSNGAICNLRRVHVPFIAFMPATASTANCDKNHLGCS